MDLKKIQKFNKHMGRQKFSKGGYIKKIGDRQYFDTGGNVATGAGAGAAAGSVVPGVGTLLGSAIGATAGLVASDTPNYGSAGQQNPYVQSNATDPNTGVLGTIGGALGTTDNFQASSANITPGTNKQELDTAYTGAQNALGNQTNLVNTLAPQAGTAAANQNALANQELAMTQGAGPNPAQNALNQNTATNVSNQAALMAGQRGASGNVGLAARNIGTQGANTQQQAVGQEATLGANQQVAAQSNLANLSNNQISQTGQAITGQNSAQQNEQATLQNANTSFNNAAVGMQSNINNVNSQTAAANQNAAANVLGGIGSAASSISSILNKGGMVKPDHLTLAEMNAHSLRHARKNFDDGGSVQADNSQSPDPTPAPSQHSFFGLPQAAASDDTPSVPSNGTQGFQDSFRKATHYDEGGDVSSPDLGKFQADDASASSPSSDSTAALPADSTNLSQSFGGKSGGSSSGGGAGGLMALAALAKGGEVWSMPASEHAKFSANHFANYFAKGGESKEIKAMVSPNERYWNPEEVEQIKHGADPMKLGRIFPGKDKVPGKDTIKNDVLPVSLEEGGIVNPLHIEKTKDPDKARLFVLKSLRATGKHLKKPKGLEE